MPGQRAVVLALTHGGGPMPLLNEPSQAQLAANLRSLAPKVLKLSSSSSSTTATTPSTTTNSPPAGLPENTCPPRAIVLFTAHWETRITSISSGGAPALLYDYGGFPAEAYAYTHPAPGSPEVAALVQRALAAAGIASRLDDERGWDHGVFVPMKLIDPTARVPVVQVSVLASQEPRELWAVGRALRALREEEGVAVVGSGSASFHNLRGLRMGGGGGGGSRAWEERIGGWMQDVDDGVGEEGEEGREEKLRGWRQWRGAYDAHPDGAAEHFSPLIVCAGVAGTGKAKSWEDEMFGLKMKSYYWE